MNYLKNIKPNAILQPFDIRHTEALISWAASPKDLLFWAGPQFRHPLESNFLREHIRQATINPFQLIERTTKKFMGYGEICSPRDHHCLLCRLTIAPALRGIGFGRELVDQMVTACFSVYGCTSISLNVFDLNLAAIACYESAGFRGIFHMQNYAELNGIPLNLLRMLYERNE